MTLRLFYLTILTFTLISCASTVNKEMVGQHVSARFTQLSDNDLISLEQYKGKTVVVAFWSTHCTSSRPIMSRLARFAEKFEGRKDVAFIAVSLDKAENIEDVKTRIKYEDFSKLENMFSGNEDYDEAFVALKGERLPYLVVIDPHGRLVDARYDDDFVYDMVK